MDQRRLQLHLLLKETSGLQFLYFQPSENIKIQYPCIVYQRESVDTTFADNKPYLRKKRYRITVIDRDPDSDIPDKIGQLPGCLHDRFYVADNLNHDVFTIHF